MPNEAERKRLKKKMLDRWENEGGSVAADSSVANQSNPASQREGGGGQTSASNKRPNSIPSRKKRRAPTQK